MKTLQGTIVSLKNTNTAQVSISKQWQHPLYKKSVKRTKHYACHVDGLELTVGEAVVIQECKPMSKTKKFVVVKKVEGNSI